MVLIDISEYNNLIQNLRRFAGGNLAKHSQEGISRNIFVTNFIDALDDARLESDQNRESINTIAKIINNLEIPILDVYHYFSVKKITIPDIELFFSNYLQFLSNKDFLLQKIYLSLIEDKSNNQICAIGDLLNKIDITVIPKNKNYIVPKYKSSYKHLNNAFISTADCIRTFYSYKNQFPVIKTEAIPNSDVYDETIAITNNELKSFVDLFNTSLENRKCILLKLNMVSEQEEFLNFINNLVLPDKENIEFTDLIQIFIHNSYFLDSDKLIKELSLKIYKEYISELNEFGNEYKQFNIYEYLNKIEYNKDIIHDLKYPDLNKVIFYVYVIHSEEKLAELNQYFKEIKKIKNFLNNFIDKVISLNPKFERSE